MRTARFLFLILLCGCAHVRATSLRLPAGALQRALPTAAPARVFTLVWEPGDFSDFVIVSSPDLIAPLNQWPAIGETGQTNFQFVADQPRQFFSLYGTNAETGESAWAQ